MIVLSSNNDSTYKPQSCLYRLLPHYGITLPITRAITCHCLAQNDASGGGKTTTLLFTIHPYKLLSYRCLHTYGEG